MNLKNYTSSVAATNTLASIEAYLIDAGATGIAKEIKNGQVAAVMFQIKDKFGTQRLIKLPANVAGVQDWLYSDYLKHHVRQKKKKEDFADQAARTAWKIMLDWVQVQMSMVHLRQAELLQVFLPYIFDGNETYYEYLNRGSFKALPAST